MAFLKEDFIETVREQIHTVKQTEQRRVDEQSRRVSDLRQAQNALEQKAVPLIRLLDELEAVMPALSYEVVPDAFWNSSEDSSLSIKIKYHQPGGALREWIEHRDGYRRAVVRETSMDQSSECLCHDGIAVLISKRGVYAKPQDYGKTTGDSYEGHHFGHEAIQIKNTPAMQRVIAQWIGRIAPESVGALQNMIQTDGPSKWDRFRDRLTHFHL